MRKTIQKSIRSLIVFTVLTGAAYPLVVTGIAQLLSPFSANGSIVTRDSVPIGSELIGQKFTSPRYFWGRPSAVDYATVPSGASQFGPTHQKLKERVAGTMRDLGIDPATPDKPYDLLLTSGSGLDPDITPQSALFQIERVAKSRAIPAESLRALISKNTITPSLGIVGMSRINVLRLNLALDALSR